MIEKGCIRDLNIIEIIKRCIVLSVAMGVLVGLLWGTAKAYMFIQANRYIELGMYNIAFYYLRSTLNDSFFLPLVIVISIGVVVSLIHLLLLVKGKSKTNRLTLGVTVFLAIGVIWVLGGYLLNQSSWYPPATSIRGILFNLFFTVVCLIVGLLIYKVLSSRYGSFMKVFGFKLILAVAAIVILVNGYFYYDEFLNIEKGTNIVFITVDTLRADHLGYHGYGRDTSPNLDGLARDGVAFSEAFVQWPQTSPSMASMLTSTYGYTNGIVGDSGSQLILDDHFVLLSEVLKNNHYNTGGIVTNLYLASSFGFAQGMDTYLEAWQRFDTEDDVRHENNDAETITNWAIDWLGANHQNGKLFMWIHYLEPHADYIPPEPFNRMFVDDALYKGAKRIKLEAPDPSYPEIGGVREIARLGNNDILDYYIAQYDAEIRYTDENIGILLNELKKLGLYDNTLIIFTADHGESLGEHNYYFWHGRLPYDDCMRVPLILKFPADSRVPSKTIDDVVGLIDLLPTVLDFLNLPIPREAEGQTLMPLIEGNHQAAPKYVYGEAGYEEDYQRMIRTKQWKLIYIPDERIQKIMNSVPFELYNIENDPGESRNLFEAQPEIAQRLKGQLLQWVSIGQSNSRVARQGKLPDDPEIAEKIRSLGYVQ